MHPKDLIEESKLLPAKVCSNKLRIFALFKICNISLFSLLLSSHPKVTILCISNC